ncbi:hypothetical protein M9H77_02815 [Catharanthus roseus]|uniref:Uncharacterized protein n=1 Tax=Catharanthus roseus TaxID=4058 RepID=A0ACC0C9M8_CATRO|nr:hypothetical protein M9H77_02815 [Catharanthus roseus]
MALSQEEGEETPEENEGRNGDLLMGLSQEGEETPIQSGAEQETLTVEIEIYKDVEKTFNKIIDIALASTARLVRLKQVLKNTKEELLKINVVDCRNRNDSVVNGGEKRVVLDWIHKLLSLEKDLVVLVSGLSIKVVVLGMFGDVLLPKKSCCTGKSKISFAQHCLQPNEHSPIPASPCTLHTIHLTQQKNYLVLKNEVRLMLVRLVHERGVDVVKILALIEPSLLK